MVCRAVGVVDRVPKAEEASQDREGWTRGRAFAGAHRSLPVEEPIEQVEGRMKEMTLGREMEMLLALGSLRFEVK